MHSEATRRFTVRPSARAPTDWGIESGLYVTRTGLSECAAETRRRGRILWAQPT
jgi:hypothetical protein